MATLQRHIGTEGSHGDPTSYDEWTFITTAGVRIVLHSGLVEWVEADGVRVCDESRGNVFTPRVVFSMLTGINTEQIEKLWERTRRRACYRCGCTRVAEEQGHPGITLRVCARCREIVGADSNERSIV